MRSAALTALLALAVSGCAMLGPNYKRPAVDLPAAGSFCSTPWRRGAGGS